jgi:hypothetical protein
VRVGSDLTDIWSRGLSRDDRDDLLSGDMSALHLSENDVYTRTTGQVFPQRQQNASDSSDWDDRLGKYKPFGEGHLISVTDEYAWQNAEDQVARLGLMSSK